MGQVAFVFAGQGAQYPGMGRTLCECSAAAAEVFRRADAIRPGTADMCFSGTAEALAETRNTQPCMYTVEMAAYAALREAGISADAMAGFSLGELSALAASGAVSFEAGLGLVIRRGALMQEAAERAESAMAAVQWACGAGIISGTGDGSTLTPQGEATRAQAATVLMRFCEEYQ